MQPLNESYTSFVDKNLNIICVFVLPFFPFRSVLRLCAVHLAGPASLDVYLTPVLSSDTLSVDRMLTHFRNIVKNKGHGVL
jgi:hypothetical protein